MAFLVHHSTRKGAKRTNEDRLGYACNGESLLMVVADGMGGRPDGEIAAELAVKTAIREFERQATPRLDRPDRFLKTTLLLVHEAILRYASERKLAQTPGTTCVACVIQDSRAAWAHAGDSRLYLFRNASVLVKTLDHTQARQLLEQRKISEKQAATHYGRYVIANFLGCAGSPLVEQSGHALEAGDKVLLCTDGVWNPFSDADITAALALPDLAQGVDRLVAEAERRAAANSDNVTALAACWTQGEPAPGDHPREWVTAMPWLGAPGA
jgi:serine/threonine protein phosphatase PrpC